MSGQGQSYSDEDLYTALRNADKAGDTESARTLSMYLQGRQKGLAPSDAAATAIQDPDPIGRQVKMYGGAAIGAAANLLGLPGDIREGVSSGLGYLTGADPKGISNVLGLGIPAVDSADAVKATTALGLTNRPEATPLTPTEKVLAGGVEGTATSLPIIAATGGLAAGPLALGAATGFASGAAGAGAHQLWPNSWAAPLLAGAAAGFGIGGLKNGLDNMLTGRGLKGAVAGAEGELEAAKSAAAALPAKAEALASQISPVKTLEEAGQRVKSSFQDWYNNVFPAKLAAAKAPVARLIDPTTQVPLGNYEAALKQIVGSGGPLKRSIQALGSTTVTKLSQAFNSMNDVLGMAKDLGMEEHAFKPTWSNVEDLRTALAGAGNSAKLVKSIGQANLDTLHDALTADLKAVARSVSPKALTAFNKGEATTAQLRGVAKVVGSADKIAPADTAAALLASARRGGTTLQTIRGVMPSVVDDLGAANLRLSPGSWNELSPEGKVALYPNASHVQAMDTHVAGASRVPAAEAKLAAAQASLAAHAHPSPNFGESLVGSSVGADLGALGAEIMWPDSGLHDIAGGAAGSLLGMALPRVARPLIRGYVQNPGNLRYPLIGAAAGIGPENQLTATQISGVSK